ncbi:MAG: hypothetical protein SGARI_001065, partial [Bacillariaceae sp.]
MQTSTTSLGEITLSWNKTTLSNVDNFEDTNNGVIIRFPPDQLETFSSTASFDTAGSAVDIQIQKGFQFLNTLNISGNALVYADLNFQATSSLKVSISEKARLFAAVHANADNAIEVNVSMEDYSESYFQGNVSSVTMDGHGVSMTVNNGCILYPQSSSLTNNAELSVSNNNSCDGISISDGAQCIIEMDNPAVLTIDTDWSTTLSGTSECIDDHSAAAAAAKPIVMAAALVSMALSL